MSTPYDPKRPGAQIVNPGSGSPISLGGSDISRILPRQLSTGNQRGTQTITGSFIVADPVTNNPVITISGVDQNQVFSDPITQINQIVIGSFGDGSYGMKVAKPGINVLNADVNQLIFNSNQNMFKIAATGTVTAPAVPDPSPASDVATSVVVNTHVAASTPTTFSAWVVNATYPFILNGVLVIKKTVAVPMTSTTLATGDGTAVTLFSQAFTYVEGGEVWFGVTRINYLTGTTWGAQDIKYYIFQETAV